MRTLEAKLVIRMSNDAKEWLAARAASQCRSMNGEILVILKAQQDADAQRRTRQPQNSAKGAE